MSYDVNAIRAQFPILSQTVSDKPLVYLDNAASVQKPQAVIDAITKVYTQQYANVHRGVHYLSAQTTIAYDAARERVRAFLGAADAREIVFTRGATEGINLVAASFLAPNLKADDEILITALEHHANIVPWQIICQRVGAKLRVVPMLDNGELDIGKLPELITPRTRLFGLTHVSNAIGTINPVKEMVAEVKKHNIPVLIDGAQATPHMSVDVRDLDVDFYVFSGHKIYGPSGIGALYAKKEHLESMEPYQSGGDMIASVTYEHTEYAEVPQKFEAGTPNIEGAIGMGAAIAWMQEAGIEKIATHEHQLLEYATEKVRVINGLTIIGEAKNKAGVLSFLLKNAHPHDVGTMLDNYGVAVRTGRHCAQPLMACFSIGSTSRASFAAYNTHEEVDVLVHAIEETSRFFG